MSAEIAIDVRGLGKCYKIYDQPRDRLKQFILPRLQIATSLPEKRYFREFWALRGVSFQVFKGETVGIVGRNGSGKSTLLQMICGTLNPTAGEVRTTGRVAALLELGSGFNPEFTGRENVYMSGAILGLDRSEIDARFKSIEDFAEIGEFIEQPVKKYSSGMMVRLAFSVAINVDPEILVVDEALSVGDELFQRKCFSRIEEIRSAGATVLFVSHSGAQIIELCDRALLIDSGELLSVGDPKTVVSTYYKLLYAPTEKRDAIRKEMAQAEAPAFSNRDAGEETSREHTGQNDAEETYDANLRPTSSFDYESHGPRISDPVILSEDGRMVNGLVRGRRYKYRYLVEFDAPASSVRFGMAIKTTSGYTLAAALSVQTTGEALVFVEKGRTLQVEFSFSCHLNPGTYFMNAGVFGVVDGTEIVLHRRVDVAAFRVLPLTSIVDTGAVSLEFKPFVEDAK
jgi:lipopolysaccharide transport system ATP-binding protein